MGGLGTILALLAVGIVIIVFSGFGKKILIMLSGLMGKIGGGKN